MKRNINFGPFAMTLLLFSICFITVVGAELAADWHNNILLLLLVLLIAIIVLCSCLRQLVPSWAYPFLIVAIAFCLLFHVSLISPYLIAYDVHEEYYFARLTALNSIWDRTLPDPSGYNGMLSITILPVMCSTVLGADLNGIFKNMYPLLYSLVPLVLYLAYRKQTSPRIAFLSVFMFMSSEIFYIHMLGLARQMIAGLFLALLVFLILDRKISARKRSFLFLVFGAGLIVSHYSVCYIFMVFIVFALCFARLFKGSQMARRGVFSIETVLLYVAITFAWYIFVSPIEAENAVRSGNYILRQILAFASPPGLIGLIPPYISPIHQVAKYLFLGVHLFVVLGLLLSIFTNRRRMFSSEYLALSAGSMLILAACMGIPSFVTATFDIGRFYNITMFFLSLFGVLGIIITVDWIGRGIASLPSISRKLPIARLSAAGTVIAAVLLVSLLLFQTGLVYEVTRDEPTSISLSIARREVWTPSMDTAYTPVEDVVSARWLSENAPNMLKVYAGYGNCHGVLTSYALIPNGQRIAISNFMPTLRGGEFLYLGSANTLYGRLDNLYGFSNTSQLVPLLDRMDTVYSNGQGRIYCFP